MPIAESMKGLIDLQKEKTSCNAYKNEVVYEGDQLSSINYIGFLFNGENIRIRPRAIIITECIEKRIPKEDQKK